MSSTVHDLLPGGDWELRERGEHTLEGVDGVWRLYELRVQRGDRRGRSRARR